MSEVWTRLCLAVSAWVAWTTLVTWVGNWAFRPQRGRVSWWRVAGLTGIAQAPGALRALGVAEALGPAPAIAALGGQAVALAVAARVAFEFRGFGHPAALIAVSALPFMAAQVGVVLLLDFALS
jgi:hypothetical protein